MDAREILKTLIREYGGTQKVFASIIGTTQPTIANWIAANQIPEGGIAKICKALPDVSFEWLTGKEDTPRRGYKEPEYVTPSRTPIGKPFYSQMPASAGQAYMGDDVVVYDNIYIPNQNAELFIPVKGNSMEPTLDSGDIVGVRRLDGGVGLIRPNDIYLISTRENERMLKRIKNINNRDPNLTLYSDNPSYAPFHVEKEAICSVHKVVTVIKMLE